MAPRIWSVIRNRKALEGSQSNILTRLRARRQPRAPYTESRDIESRQKSRGSASDLPGRAEATVELNTTSDTDFGIHRQDTTPSSASVRRPRDNTFRLRGVPKEWDKAEVQRRVKDGMSLSDNTEVVVRSLAQNPYRHEEQVATIEFSNNDFTGLEENAKSEWPIMIEGHDLLLDTHFFGMTPLHAADDSSCDVDVIALSGLNGHAFGSFKSKTNKPTYMWLRDSLPSDIPHARVFVYGYDTRIINSDLFQNIGDLGQQLKKDLILMRKTAEPSADRHLILIGHSLGGIIIKSAINKMTKSVENDHDIVKSIFSVLFFGVPNQGMDIRSLIPMVGDNPNRELLQSLGMESEILHNLSQNFETNFNSPHSMVFSFYETKQSPTANKVEGKWTMSGPSAVLVDRRSATNGRHWEQDDGYCYPVGRTHSEMVKFDSRHDAVYAQALHCLEKYQKSPKTSSTALSKNQQECLKSLSFPEQKLRLDDIHTATNTCNWLLWHETYQAWINDPSGLLWIEGAPGVGKSVLMKHIWQVLDEKFSRDDYLLLSFFVHGQGSVLQKSKLGLLRAILHQLLRQKPDVFSFVLPKYVEKCQTMGSWEWSEKELQNLFQKCLESVCQSTHVILLVDALDELGGNIAREVVDYFQHLIDSLRNDASNLRICFSCRHYPTISFNDGHRICVEKENSDDIRYVIHSKLAKVADSDAILSLITENANGVFQWAVLVSDEAQRLSMDNKMPEHIRQKIQNLPKSLHDLYHGLLKDAPQGTLRLFQWVCFAREDLDARTLRHALAVSTEQSCSSLQHYEEILGFEDSEPGVSSMVRTLSRGLAKVTKTFSRLQVNLIHQSVGDFLMSSGFRYLDKSLEPDYLGRISHCRLSEACFKYLATQKFPTHTDEKGNFAIVGSFTKKFRFRQYSENIDMHEHRRRPNHVDKNMDEIPLLNKGFCRYAFIHGLQHVRMAKEPKYLPEFLLQFFERPVQHRDRKSLGFFGVRNSYQDKDADLDLDKVDRYFRYTSGFHHSLAVAALFINKDARICLEFFLDYDNSPNSLKCHGHPSLYVALIHQGLDTADLVLETARLDVSAEGQYGETLLICAIQDEQLELADAIISSPKVHPDHQDERGRTPLSYAAESGSSKAAKALLAVSKINQDARDKQGRSPLSYAAARGSLEIVDDLIHSPQIDPNSQDIYGRVPLSYASQNGFLGVVRTLLASPKVEPDIQDHRGRTPLSYASQHRCLGVTQTLLASPKVSPNIQDHNGRTPLSYAYQNRSLGIIQALLESSKVNPDSQDCQGRTLLSYASQHESLRIVQILLASSNVDPDSKDCHGRTPLSYASQHGSLKIVQTLLASSKVNPDSQDCQGRTPLSYAAEEGHRDVAFYLLRKHSCDPAKEDNWGRTPVAYCTEPVPHRHGLPGATNSRGRNSATWVFEYQDVLEEAKRLQKENRDREMKSRKGE